MRMKIIKKNFIRVCTVCGDQVKKNPIMLTVSIPICAENNQQLPETLRTPYIVQMDSGAGQWDLAPLWTLVTPGYASS